MNIMIRDPYYLAKTVLGSYNLYILKDPFGSWHYSCVGTFNTKDEAIDYYHKLKEEEKMTPPGKKYFEELFRVSKNQIIFGGNYFTTYLPPKMGWIVWDKGQHGLTMSDGELAWSSFDKALRIITLNRCTIGERGGNIHRCQKPVKLYAEILRKNAKEGDKIFDSHLGSGSSRIAAYGLGFDFYATEIDEEYFEAQEERFHRECFGEIKTERGRLVQTNLFDK